MCLIQDTSILVLSGTIRLICFSTRQIADNIWTGSCKNLKCLEGSRGFLFKKYANVF